jgi:hypothetical protein
METRIHRLYLGLRTRDGSRVNAYEAIEYVAAYLKNEYGIDGMTVLNGVGYWKCQAESSLIFEVIDSMYLPWNGLTPLAQQLRNRYDQESVLTTRHAIIVEFI